MVVAFPRAIKRMELISILVTSQIIIDSISQNMVR